MSNSTATRQRPISPHLFIYKPIPTMVMSIMHRITGAILYVGTLLVVWWLVAASTSPASLATANGVLGSWFGVLVLIGFTWALYHHLLGGIRHLLWDTGVAMEKHTSTALAWATIAGSVLLTAITWLVYLFVI